MPRRLLLALSALALSAAVCRAQPPVPVGHGSYAAFPPPALAKLATVEREQLYLVHPHVHPIPTNKWWTQLVVSQYAKTLWVFPLKINANPAGLNLFFPIKWLPSGSDPLTNYPLGVGGVNFAPTDSRAKSWSDRLVSFRMQQDKRHFMDVTLGEGMPCVWIVCHHVQPVLTLPGGPPPQLFTMAGKLIQGPFRGDCLGIKYDHRSMGVFAPNGSVFLPQKGNGNGTLAVRFTGGRKFLVLCPLPAPKDLRYVHRYAYAMPVKTRFGWKYHPRQGLVTTTWNITAKALKGGNHKVIQGWLPHHYDHTKNNLKFNKMEFLSPRGPLRCAVGNKFVISYPYDGIVPNLPAPQSGRGVAPYSPARMHTYLKNLAAHPSFGADTYWGGKDLLRWGQCALEAQQTQDPTYQKFVKQLRGALENWFTYKPGKKDHFFAYYRRWGSLVGMNPSYGSEAFNDHHFHYGYFTFATALEAMHDRAFAKNYGGMATLLAKDYADWNRHSKRFPFFRTFDIWAGHSWAGGTSSPGGENQESSSEAVQSWAGLIFLGQALHNKKMRDAGIMGYSIETQAVLDYWFNATGNVFPPEWRHHVTGMVWGGGKAYGTYFTADPAWIYGIQWLPASPMLSYLMRDPAAAAQRYTYMLAAEKRYAAAQNRPANAPPPLSMRAFGPSLGNVLLGYRLMFQPRQVAVEMDRLWKRPGDTVAHAYAQMVKIYYQAQAMRPLGRADFTRHGDSPTSMAYHNKKTHTETYIAWNPSSHPKTVTFYKAGQPLGHMTAAPEALTSVRELLPMK